MMMYKSVMSENGKEISRGRMDEAGAAGLLDIGVKALLRPSPEETTSIVGALGGEVTIKVTNVVTGLVGTIVLTREA